MQRRKPQQCFHDAAQRADQNVLAVTEQISDAVFGVAKIILVVFLMRMVAIQEWHIDEGTVIKKIYYYIFFLIKLAIAQTGC